MLQQNNNYVIGVDGGGTKTTAALANLNSQILRTGKSGSSNPRDVGIKIAVRNVAESIEKILSKQKKIKVLSVFIGLPAAEEEFKSKIKAIQKGLLKEKRIFRILKGKIAIGSDQLIAFRGGTNKKEGIVLIAGTGCVSHGWKGKREYKTNGWGWLTDGGAAFWIGQKVLQAVLKDLDGQGVKTLLTDFVFWKFRIRKRDPNLLNKKIYSSNFVKTVSSLSLVCNMAAEKRDKLAKNILTEAGKELAISVKTVIKKLSFSKEKFPLILVGSVLKSKIVLDVIKREIKKIAPGVQFIYTKKEPVVGAIKLALEKRKQ